jgi:hypothetical protein
MVEHWNPLGFLQPLPFPEWKRETISMDFITRLPKLAKQNNTIIVVVEKLNTSTHFVPFK